MCTSQVLKSRVLAPESAVAAYENGEVEVPGRRARVGLGLAVLRDSDMQLKIIRYECVTSLHFCLSSLPPSLLVYPSLSLPLSVSLPPSLSLPFPLPPFLSLFPFSPTLPPLHSPTQPRPPAVYWLWNLVQCMHLDVLFVMACFRLGYVVSGIAGSSRDLQPTSRR